MRADAMRCAGNDDVHTPNLDQLSTSGTRCTSAYTNNPLCTPSRACLITGQHSVTNRVVSNDLPLPTEAPSVGELFGDAGHRTGYIGKWHLDGVPRHKWTPPGPRRQGFDDYWAVFNCAHDYFNTKYYRDSPDLIERTGYEPEIQTDLAIEFMYGTEPFCLFLSWGPPHGPYELVPDRYREMYNPAALEMPDNAEPLVASRAETRGPPVRHWGTSEAFETGEPYDYDDAREVLADYYANVTALDDQVGRLMDALATRGLAEDTIVVFTSDHGDNLWAHGYNQKGLPYKESINVPFLIRWPDEIPSDAVNDTLISTVDIAPTLAGLAGLDAPDEMEGEDLSAALRGNADRDSDSVYLMGSDWRAVRTDRYTYARFVEDHPDHGHIPDRDWLLFDNETDPLQFRNRVLDSEYADHRDELRAELDEWAVALNDPLVSLPELVRQFDVVDEWNAQVDWFLDIHEGYEHQVGYVDDT
jgi:arylsulfatase A-like enzyme